MRILMVYKRHLARGRKDELVDLGDLKGANFCPFPAALARQLAELMLGMAVSIFLKIRKVSTYRDEIPRLFDTCRFETNFKI